MNAFKWNRLNLLRSKKRPACRSGYPSYRHICLESFQMCYKARRHCSYPFTTDCLLNSGIWGYVNQVSVNFKVRDSVSENYLRAVPPSSDSAVGCLWQRRPKYRASPSLRVIFPAQTPSLHIYPNRRDQRQLSLGSKISRISGSSGPARSSLIRWFSICSNQLSPINAEEKCVETKMISGVDMKET